jgi:hypothetical protein
MKNTLGKNARNFQYWGSRGVVELFPENSHNQG